MRGTEGAMRGAPVLGGACRLLVVLLQGGRELPGDGIHVNRVGME